MKPYFELCKTVYFRINMKINSMDLFTALCVLLMYWCFNISLFAQSTEFCGVFPTHVASTSNIDSIYFDRFGNSYDLYNTTLSSVSTETCTSSSGYFELTFFDIDADLQPVFCKVFEDLSNLIPQRINVDGCSTELSPSIVTIFVGKTSFDRPGVIMGASANHILSTYTNSCDVNCLISTNIERKIKGSSHLNIPNASDGTILINTNFTGKFWTKWDEPCEDGYDAYSIILHEALHIFGFASSIDLDGTGGSDGYFTWDYFLNTTPYYNPTGGSSDIKPLLVSDCNKNCWGLNSEVFDTGEEMLNAVFDNCSNEGNIDFVFGQNAIAPILGRYYTPTTLTAGDLSNYLSHLNVGCNGQDIPYYVMEGVIGEKEERRTITNSEKTILCDLGYEIESCDGCYLISNNEFHLEYQEVATCCELFYIGCPGEEVEIPFDWLLCNDFSNNDIGISDAWPLSSFSVSLNASSITFTPSSQGRYTIGYTIKNCDCFMQNATVDVFIGPCTDCDLIDPCENLVCLETFEEYAENSFPLSIHEEVAGVYWSINGSNTVDICEDENGNHYLNIAEIPIINQEGLAMKLSEPIEKGCTLKVSFDASSRNENIFSWFVSSTPPCPNNITYVTEGCNSVNCGTYDYLPVCIPEGSIPTPAVANFNPLFACQLQPNLEHREFSWTNNLDVAINYIILIPQIASRSNFIDNIIVKSNCIDLSACFQYELIGECFEIQFESCEESSTASHYWDFGDGEHSSDENPAHTYSSSGTYNVTQTITDACGNSSSIEHEVVTGVCCTDVTINSNTTWTPSSILPSNGLFHTLTIQHGKSLTIQSGVVLKFCPGGSLIIEDGAFVRNSGTLTSLGDIAWNGVFVTGNPNVGQNANHILYASSFGFIPQGYFWADEGSLIENAIIGVRNYGINNVNVGGIIKATGAIFRNNSIAIHMAHYGQPRPSIGVFTACEFLNSSNYPIDNKFVSFVRLDGVDGIKFNGCTFDSDLSFDSYVKYDDFGKGIHARSSEFTVQATNQGSTLPCGLGECQNRCTFNGLAHAIYIESPGAIRPYKIVNSVFNNCYRYITSIASPGGSIIFNEFNFGSIPSINISWIPKHQVGVTLAGDHSGFQLEENMFLYDPHGYTIAIGIECMNIGSGDNVIRKNHFEGLYIAHEAVGLNAGVDFFDGGLVYLCETVESTPSDGFDFLIPTSIGIDAIYSTQGEPLEAAPWLLPTGNVFAYSGSDFHNSETDAAAQFTYYYHDEGNQKPLSTLIGYQPFELFNTNSCEENYCDPPCLNGQDITTNKNIYYRFIEHLDTAILNYNFAISQNDSIEANNQKLLASFYRGQAYRIARNIVNYCSLDTVNFNIDSLIAWYGNLNTFGGDIMIVRELASNNRIGDALDKLDEIESNRELSVPQEVDLSNIRNIYSILDTTDIYNLTIKEKSIIRNIAQSNIGISSGISRAILSYFNETYPIPYYLGAINNIAIEYRQDSSDNNLLFNPLLVMPNPAKDFIYIQSNEAVEESSEYQLFVANIYGQIIYSRSINSNELFESIKVDISNWSQGLYFVIVRDKNKLKHSRTFIVY